MGDVPKQSEARRRLALHMDRRRIELGMQWTDVAQESGLTTETLRQARFGSNQIRGLTQAAIERALQWESGSIEAVLAGGDPVPAVARTLPNGATLTPKDREEARRLARRLLALAGEEPE